MYNTLGHDLLSEAGADVVVVDSDNPDEVKQALHGAKALWVRTPERITADVLDAGRELVVVSTRVSALTTWISKPQRSADFGCQSPGFGRIPSPSTPS